MTDARQEVYVLVVCQVQNRFNTFWCDFTHLQQRPLPSEIQMPGLQNLRVGSRVVTWPEPPGFGFMRLRRRFLKQTPASLKPAGHRVRLRGLRLGPWR